MNAAVRHVDTKQQPHSVEAEQQLLGALMLDESTWAKVGDMLEAEHFFDPVHATIFAAIADRYRKGHMVSPVTLETNLEHHEGLKQLGGVKYLVRLAGASCSSSLVRDYARHIVERKIARDALQLATEAQEAIQSGADTLEAIARLQAGLQALPEAEGRESCIPMVKAASEAIAETLEAYQGQTSLLKTGLTSLDKILRGLGPADLMLLGGATSMGKAQPLDANVLTEAGWKKMGEIKVGDRLASVDGRPSVVTDVFPQGVVQMAKVTFIDGRTVRCCMDHLWMVHGSFFKSGPKVISTRDLMAKMSTSTAKGRISIPMYAGEHGVSGNLPLDPWLLGLIIGDGHSSSGSLRLSTDDAETLWRAGEAAGNRINLKYTATGYDFVFRGAKPRKNYLIGALRDLGLWDVRSHEKFIPKQYMEADRQSRQALLRGLMDSDGWVEKFGAVRFATTSEALARDVQQLVWSLGGVCSTSSRIPSFTHNGQKRQGRLVYTLNIRHSEPSSLFSIHKKKSRCRRTKPVSLTVLSVEFDGEAAAQCISVSHQDQLYITDNYIVTHNTAVAVDIAHRVAARGCVVGFASLEMEPAQLFARITSSLSRVPYELARVADEMSEENFKAWLEAAEKASHLPIHVFPRHVRDVAAITATAQGLKMRHKRLDLVIVDYAQLCRAPGREFRERMVNVSIGLKHMAKVLLCPVIALVQLDRRIGDRPDPRPQTYDIKETSQFETDADQIVFCHREAYFLERSGPQRSKDGTITDEARADWEAEMSRNRNLIQLIVRKNRHGRLATAELGCNMPTNRLWNLHHDEGEF